MPVFPTIRPGQIPRRAATTAAETTAGLEQHDKNKIAAPRPRFRPSTEAELRSCRQDPRQLPLPLGDKFSAEPNSFTGPNKNNSNRRGRVRPEGEP